MKVNSFRYFSGKDYAIMREELKNSFETYEKNSIEKSCYERLLSMLVAIDELDMDKQVVLTVDIDIRPKTSSNVRFSNSREEKRT